MDQDELEQNKYDLNFEDEDFELAVEDEVQLKDVLPARLKYVYDYGDRVKVCSQNSWASPEECQNLAEYICS